MNTSFQGLFLRHTTINNCHTIIEKVHINFLKFGTMRIDTSKVPPPRSKTKIFRLPSQSFLLSRPYAIAAAVGTVTTAFFTGDPIYASATSFIFFRIIDDSVLCVGGSLILSSITNQSLIISESNNRRCYSVSLIIVNNLNSIVFINPHSNT
ncbi:unnamed protein product [Trifolium pratense]|uniref:Uncharacterized protein n=1 Tax=Trifolium pratense TaxID=57577 RepID=A0ACB0LM19_TRIPR|nr:unnamed protein product [Trifolium pratense]